MPAANIHTEEYEVATKPKELSSPTRLYFKVTARNVSGDNPVEEVFLRRTTSGSSRRGVEDLEDTTARVNLLTGDYDDAKFDLRVGSRVSYLSTRQSGVEQISQFGWS